MGGKRREMTTLSAWACICLECDTEWQILMNTRLLSAGVAAGIAMFVWGAISHMALLNEIGGNVKGLGMAMLRKRFAEYVLLPDAEQG